MSYVTKTQIARAKQMDLLTYLQNYEPDKLVRVSGNTYCTREHDSLRISNGMWNWFSHQMGGRSALDYLVKVEGYSLPEAVERILGHAAVYTPVIHSTPPKKEKRLELPEMNDSTEQVEAYLRGRGIHPVIIGYCLEHGILMESRKYHNAVFIGCDQCGEPKYAALRGTYGEFKGEAAGSDKRFSFSITDNPNTDTVHLFESAIDLMSCATLRLFEGSSWKQDGMLSLAGVYKAQNNPTVPMALRQYLQDHPKVNTVRLHLDNDQIGRQAVAGIVNGLGPQYRIYDEPPAWGKDVNEQLMMRVGLLQRKKVYER